MTFSGAALRAAEEGKNTSNFYGNGSGFLGRPLAAAGNWLADTLGGTNTYARAATDAVNADYYNNQLADNMGVSRGNNSWFGRMAGGLGDYAQMGSLGVRKALRGLSNPFTDADYSDIDQQWNTIQSRRNRTNDFLKAREAAGTDIDPYWNTFKGTFAGYGNAAALGAPGIGTMAAGLMGSAINPGARQFNFEAGNNMAGRMGYQTQPTAPAPVSPMMAQAKPTGWAQTNYDPYGVSNSTSPWVQALGLGKSAGHVTNVVGRTQELKKRVKGASSLQSMMQTGPPAPINVPQGVRNNISAITPGPRSFHDKTRTGPQYQIPPFMGPPTPAKNPNRPQPVPLQAAQVNGYLMPNQFRGAHSTATEFGSPMKNMIFNYGVPILDMGMKMFNLPGLLPTTRPPFQSQNMGMRLPRSNSELLAGMGIQ